ncbi:U2 snRNP-associated SURP motif-containing protein [Choanephora cucurbitarum]|uniref:U2 snRNP-associated SURP motif-containing protein n=1 Tax=Choanephora cucurbitarum TaxID=101091 RepID=A0A1C7N455_9FUNG|nr:U2 snRNP-associated SURP motif-containing protein [Choanephora cucurbitarum]
MSEKRKREETSEEEEEEEFQRPIKPIPASKLQAFTIGSHKKTAFQRHKEEADLKKQQENLEAAKVYAEFVASFEEPKPYQLGTTSFVKSGTLMPKDPVDQYHNQTPAVPSTFKPMPFVKAGESPMQSTLKVKHKLESLDDEDDALAKLKSIPKAQKKRNLDSFLEEIKKGQEVRTRNDNKHGTAPIEGDTIGSFDEGNPNTTNLYVGNINPTTTEAGLCQEFGKFGPIASVKIMWPRTQEEKDKGNNCGFVSFMTRKDAAEAIRGLDGKELHGFTLRVGWGKAVPLPATPFFVLDKKVSLGQAKTGLPFNAQIYPGPPGVNSRPRAEVHVTKPVDVKLMRVMHRMIERVLKHGPLFEAIIMDKELNNPTFKFLFDNSSPEHIYYRWRLYSLSQGDTKSRWRDEPFQMFEGGPWWIPPELPLLDKETEPMFDTDDELADQDNVAKGTLGQIAKQRLGGLIREVTFQRGTIARAMSFAIDHSDAASEVVDVLSKSILIPDIPFSVKLARLYLVSDILHNSSVHVSNAWKYRKEFEAHLPVIFDHFNSIYRSINARLKAEQVRKYISSIIHVWENWMIFPKYYTDQLSDIFLKKEKASSITQPEDVDGEPIEDVDGEPMEDVDGEPIEDVDGEPMDDVDGEPMEDADGEPIQDNEEEDFTQVNDMFS